MINYLFSLKLSFFNVPIVLSVKSCFNDSLDVIFNILLSNNMSNKGNCYLIEILRFLLN